MGALLVVFLWISINAIISYFEDKKEGKRNKSTEKSVVKTPAKNYNFDLFYETEEQNCSYLKKSA